MPLPALRPVESYTVDHEGEMYICLRDAEGYVEQQILLTPVAFFIACLLDGRNEIADVQTAFTQQVPGQTLDAEDISKVITILDDHCLLYTPAFETLVQTIQDEFQNTSVRPAYLAGQGYPDNDAELREFLLEQVPRQEIKEVGTAKTESSPSICLIAPHIDFHRGGRAYASAYHHLQTQGQPEVVIIFGTAHVSPPVPFVLTRKDFATPFGTLKTEKDIVQRLADACDWDPFAFELVHRTEHSIEFQMVMLSYLFGSDVRIVPVLCGSFHGEVGEAATVTRPEAMLQACADIVSEHEGKITVIAAADLAHVGRRFGDEFDIEEDVVEAVRHRDEVDLQQALQSGAKAFYDSVMQDNNQRRVCGLNCIYASLRVTEDHRGAGQLLHYDYAHDPAGGIVSFASLAFPAG